MTSTHENLAVLEVRAPGGPPTYDSLSLGALERVTREHRPSHGAVLRLFRANTASRGLTKEVIASLDRDARELFELDTRTGALQVLKESWESEPTHAPLWFAFHKNSRPLTRLSADDVAAAAARFASAEPLAIHSFIVELQRGAGAASLGATLDELRKAITSSTEVLFITSHAPTNALLAAPATNHETPDPAAAAAARRDELLNLGWPTSEQVSRANHSTADNRSQWAAVRRAAGELLGVWSVRDRTYRHPTFQFKDGMIRPQVKELLAALAAIPGFNATDDAKGWRRAFWLYGARGALADKDGCMRTPAEVFETDPAAVIALAESDAKVDPNAHW
ncbi:hypothetical protein R2APBS1_2026 [Rhodanobacter denitrificans]|uniref:Uncharacterized protein n=1 Tax=Rhodanobacter denitrificans TaxID=666685 RepID=M4NEG1_9GAMM|nr:hypothetical protein [Rhodanobacter denitrificans]AGG89149.1 hypothetical protein R2APBS1_2026 [Rhodanobacter denitrificans]